MTFDIMNMRFIKIAAVVTNKPSGNQQRKPQSGNYHPDKPSGSRRSKRRQWRQQGQRNPNSASIAVAYYAQQGMFSSAIDAAKKIEHPQARIAAFQKIARYAFAGGRTYYADEAIRLAITTEKFLLIGG